MASRLWQHRLQLLVVLLVLFLALVVLWGPARSPRPVLPEGTYLLCFWNVENLFDDQRDNYPDEADRQTVHDIIFDELCLGVFTGAARAAYVEVIERLKARGCDAVALVCTEIPLLVTADISPLPILDSTRLLAAAAVEVALGERPMPAWRGGSA